MGSIYGDILLSFTEQFETFPYYSMNPKVNSGFEDKELIGNIKALRHNTSGMIKDNNGNLIKTQGFQIWTMELLVDGNFIEIEEEFYRLWKSKNWKRQGGFVAYDVEKVTGDDSTLTNDIEINTGEDNFR